MAVPKNCIILLAGVPASGKSTFGRHLSRAHDFAHYDLECYPRGWPHPELKSFWDTSLAVFISQIKQYHPRVALDWGFPVHCLPVVRELQHQRVRLLWFQADVSQARKVFVERGGIALSNFDKQVADIGKAGYPKTLACEVVETLSNGGTFLDLEKITDMIFP